MRLLSMVLAVLSGALFMAEDLAAQYGAPNQLRIAMQYRGSGSHLGVRLTDVDSDRAKVLRLGDARGAEVVSVEENGPAEQAGIRPGDVLLSYNGENIVGAQQLGRLVAETPQGRKVTMQYSRDGKLESSTITTGAPRAANVNFPGGPGFEVPDLQNFAILDIPNPMLIWKNSALGIEGESVDSQLARYFGVKRGVLIRSVEKGSPAEKAGLKAGDVVTAIGGREVSAPRDVSSFMRSARYPRKTIAVALTRERKPITVQIPVSENRE
ncbi:MAG TPA: PDZ domain-containing protein [Bryobacteraceae bacterium]|nr:PDZ domain-containing protein [Bryobacteraceae bacterium]